MRIALVEPSQGLWHTGKFCRHSQLEPLALCYIGAAALEEGHIVDIFLQRNMSDAAFVKEIVQFKPDIVGFSTYTYNFQASCELAKVLKEELGSIVTIFGGHHISGCPEVVENQPIDFGVIGEGEISFLELIRNLEANDEPKKVEGIVVGNGKLHISPPRPRIKDLDRLPWPIRNRKLLECNKVESIAYPPASQQKAVAQVITARGCMYNCSFCCSPTLWGRNVVFRKPERVVDEIEYLHREYGTNLIHFSNLTMNINRSHLLGLCEVMIQRKLDIYWTASGNLNLLDEETVDAMARAGCSRFGLGIESLSLTTLSRIKPAQKMRLDDIQKNLELVKNYGIFTRGFFMIGYPWETREHLKEMAVQMRHLPLDDIRITFLTPFPGTSLYEDCVQKGLINGKDFSKFSVENPILPVQGMSTDELLTIRREMFRSFYRCSAYEKRQQEQNAKFPERKSSYEELLRILEGKGLL